MSSRSLALCVVMALVEFALPCRAMGQGAIAGVVRDPTGAVLPGVTVEATGAAQRGYRRTAVAQTDGTYAIGDLAAGTYAVTFSLPGFRTLRQDGIEVVRGATAVVTAVLEVGPSLPPPTPLSARLLESFQYISRAGGLPDIREATSVTGREIRILAWDATFPTPYLRLVDDGRTVQAWLALSWDFDVPGLLTISSSWPPKRPCPPSQVCVEFFEPGSFPAAAEPWEALFDELVALEQCEEPSDAITVTSDVPRFAMQILEEGTYREYYCDAPTIGRTASAQRAATVLRYLVRTTNDLVRK